jgi:hypothetical protein
MLALALPLLMITTDLAEELPTATLPKFTEAGFTESNGAAGATATAVNPTGTEEFVASLRIFRLPEIEPDV